MSRLRRMSLSAIVPAVLLLAALPLAGVAHAGQPVARPATTSVHLRVTGCDTCHVVLQQALSGSSGVWTSRAKPIGGDERVTFVVPQARTHGMSVQLRAPWADHFSRTPHVATRYPGHYVGSAVNKGDAQQADHAQGCWAGTSAAEATIAIAVKRVRQTVAGDKVLVPLAYASTTLSSWRPVEKVTRGVLATHGVLRCAHP